MYNVIIISKDLKFPYIITNMICPKFPNIKVYSIFSNILDTLNFISINIVDILIFDSKLNTSEINYFFNCLKENNLKNYENSIFLISNNNHYINTNNSNKYIFSLCPINKLENNLKIFLNNKTTSIIEKINNELHKINYNFSYVGTKYLADAISIVSKKYNNEICNINLSKQIYPIIAKKYNKSVYSIKTNIIRSTTNMYYDCDETTFCEYFGYAFSFKPTIKDIIFTILTKIKKELKNF